MGFFVGKLRDELLNGEIFDTQLEAQVVMENRRREYNRVQPHCSLGYRPPARETLKPKNFISGWTSFWVRRRNLEFSLHRWYNEWGRIRRR